MSQQFPGVTDFLDSNGKKILTIDTDSGFVQITYRAPNGLTILELTNTASLSLLPQGNSYPVRLDGSLGWMWLGGATKNGRLAVRDAQDREAVVVDAQNAVVTVGAQGKKGDLFVRDAAGANRIHLAGQSGDIILTNADCAEDFDLAPDQEADPGTVMVLDAAGAVCNSTQAYDRKVAGIVSGAGDCRPAIVLNRRSRSGSSVSLALVGKVFCKVEATSQPIEVGDLLTTSAIEGHAMKATCPLKGFGAVIGKALAPLGQGCGLIPVLAALR